MLKINEHNAVRNLSIKLDANFKPGDHHLVLTHRRIPSVAEAQRLFANFVRRLARAYKARGSSLRWVMVIEYEHTRPHHHFIVSGGLPADEIAKVWGCGIVIRRDLYGESFYGLAKYLVKETHRTFSDPAGIPKQRYSCSRNLVTPVTKVEYLSAVDFDGDPKPPKDYYIDPGTVYRGENPFTGARYMEYIALSLTDDPRIKEWRRGKKTRPKNSVSLSAYRRSAPRQEEIRC
jgi:hypothetical protein